MKKINKPEKIVKCTAANNCPEVHCEHRVNHIKMKGRCFGWFQCLGNNKSRCEVVIN